MRALDNHFLSWKARKALAYKAALVQPGKGLEHRLWVPGVNCGNPRRLRRSVWDDEQKAAAVDEIAARVRARYARREAGE
jgi:hypothetical protein